MAINNATQSNATTTSRTTRSGTARVPGRGVETSVGQGRGGRARGKARARANGGSGNGTGTTPRGGSSAIDPTTMHCILSAAYHDRQGPIHGEVDGALDGMSMVKYANKNGETTMGEVEAEHIHTGPDVEQQYANGKPVELRYRFYLNKVEDGEDTHWRLCQVVKTEEGDGEYMVHFRPKDDTGSLVVQTVDDFREMAIKTTKEDFILEIGDWTPGDVTAAEVRAAIGHISRVLARQQHPAYQSIKLIGRLGLMERTTLEAHMREEQPERTPSDTSIVRGRAHLDETALGGMNTEHNPRLERPLVSFCGASTTRGMDDSMNTWDEETTGRYNSSPRLSVPATTTGTTFTNGKEAPYSKYDYNPKWQNMQRTKWIWGGNDYRLTGTRPHQQLESIRSQEIIPCPGSGIAHAHAIWGFNWKYVPLSLFNIRFVGGRQNRRQELGNTNKAIEAAIKELDIPITNMPALGHTTLMMISSFRRWNRSELTDLMHRIDECARKAAITEELNATKSIVSAYVTMIEIALRAICSSLDMVSEGTYDETMAACKIQVRQILSLHGEVFAYTVAAARTEAMQSRLQGGGGGSGGNTLHGGGNGKANKKQKGGKGGNAGNENAFPSTHPGSTEKQGWKILMCWVLGRRQVYTQAGTMSIPTRSYSGWSSPRGGGLD